MKNKGFLNGFISYNKNHFFFSYTIAFAAIALIAFSSFIIFDCSFIWNPDGVSQHYPALVYWGKYLREVAKSVLAGSLVIPQYDFSIGMGEDVLTSLHYYVIGDPLNLLFAVIPSKYTVYLFDFLVVFRLYLSGLAFCALARYKKHPVFNSIMGSLIYVFNSYVLVLGVKHPFFINPMIYFPLIIIGIEMIFEKKRPYLFILMVFICGISNFYFFYVLTLFSALYIFVRLFFVYKEHIVKSFLGSLIKFGGCWLLGTLMAAVIFIPVALTFISSSRESVDYGLNLFYDINYYKNFLSGFAGRVFIGKNTFLGLTVLGIVGVIILFINKKKNTFLKLSFIILTVFLLFPVFGKIINGFSYVTNRWVWAYALLVSYIFTVMLAEIRKISFKQSIILSIAAVLFCIYVYITPIVRTEVSVAVGIGFVFFALGAVIYSAIPYIKTDINTKMLSSCWKYFILSAAVFGIFCNTLYSYNRGESTYITTFMPVSNASEYAYNNGYKKIKNIQNTETAVERYEADNLDVLDYNNSIVNETMGTTEYLSLVNNYVNDLQLQMGLVHYNFSNVDSSGGDPFLQAVESVKYYAAKNKSKTPYGYDTKELEKVRSNSSDTKGEALKIYENKNYVPFGFTYKNIISQQEFDSLNSADKRNALIQAMVVNDANDYINTSVSELNIQSKSVPVSFEEGSNYRIIDGVIYTSKKNTTVKIKTTVPAGGQAYLLLKDIEFESLTNEEAKKIAEPEEYSKLTAKELQSIRYEDKKANEILYSEMTVKANGKNTKLLTATPDYDWYSGITEYTVNLGYCSKQIEEFEISFNEIGAYKIGSAEIISEALDDFEEKTALLSKNTLQNLKIETDRISGSIITDENEWLFLSIPYSENWSAFVDGTEVQIHRANTAFSAIELSGGEHTVELKYSNTCAFYSLFASVTGFVCFAGVIIACEIYNKKQKSYSTHF